MMKKYNLLWIDDDLNGRMKTMLEDASKLFKEKFYIEPITDVQDFEAQLSRVDITWDAFLCDYNNFDSEIGKRQGYTGILRLAMNHARGGIYKDTPHFCLSGQISLSKGDDTEAIQQLKDCGYIKNYKNGKYYWDKNPKGEHDSLDVFDDIYDYLETLYSDFQKHSSTWLRMQYADGFAALRNLGLEDKFAENYLKLLNHDSNDANTIAKETLRPSFESACTILKNENILQPGYKLNQVPSLLSGDSLIQIEETDRLPKALKILMDFFLKNAQDVMHDNEETCYLAEYLCKTGDNYMLHLLAVAGLDLLTWMSNLYDKYKGKLPPIKITANVIDFRKNNVGKDCAIAIYKGKEYAFFTNGYSYNTGDQVIIESPAQCTDDNLKADYFSLNVRVHKKIYKLKATNLT